MNKHISKETLSDFFEELGEKEDSTVVSLRRSL